MTALDNYYRFISAVRLMAITDSAGKTNHQLGFKLPDKEYVPYAAPFLEFPARMMQQDFLKAMNSPETYKVALGIIDEHNKDPNFKNDQWIVLPFRAQFITTIDTDNRTYGRLLVVLRDQPAPDGGKIDKWILWGIVTPDMNPSTPMHNVSMFSVHTDAAGKRQTTYFGDFWRTKTTSGDIEIGSSFLRDPDPSGNCYQCHKSSILPIHPKVEYKLDADGKLVEKADGDQLISSAVNKFVRNYGPPDFGTMPSPNTDLANYLMDVLDYGPTIGPSDRVRTDDFIASCSPSQLSAESVTAVKGAMQCDSCHTESQDGVLSLGRINYVLALHSRRDVTKTFEAMESPIATFVKKGWMPPNNHLSDSERNALSACLLKEYFDTPTKTGLFVDWLSGKGD